VRLRVNQRNRFHAIFLGDFYHVVLQTFVDDGDFFVVIVIILGFTHDDDDDVDDDDDLCW